MADLRGDVLVDLLRQYLAEHDRTMSNDNPDGKRCHCPICPRARLALRRGRRGVAQSAVAKALNDALEHILHEASRC